ncbi:MAG: GT4 family glycosyltransferase PelF, partial [Planctomycetota bacterium]
PRARIYHAACTGYAGFLGAKASLVAGSPFLLTEHGIYTRERRIEIFNADWISDAAAETASLDLRRGQNYYKQWWVNFFLGMSRTAYDAAEHIYSLFEANRRDQISEGAPAEMLTIIPNGVRVERYLEVEPSRRRPDEPLRIGFVGRITEIKDIKTLLRSLDILRQRGVVFEAFLMGPLDEEEGYAAECQELSVALGIGEQVHFTGRIQVLDYLPRLDVVLLTSISEGLPFVILEANGASLPVVSTDVGACRELLQGRTREDRALGESGFLAPVGSPTAIAAALERLARDPDLARRMGLAGRERVRRFYDLHDVMATYQREYEHHLFAGANRRAVGQGLSREIH